MRPIIFEIGPLPVYGYGFMVLLGFLFAMKLAASRFRAKGLDPELTYDMAMIAMVTGVLGSRLFYLAQYSQRYEWNLFNFSDGGFSILGAIVGFLVFVACYRQAESWNYLAFTAVAIMISKYKGFITPAPGQLNVLDLVFLGIAGFFAWKNYSLLWDYWKNASVGKQLLATVTAIAAILIGFRGGHCYLHSQHYAWEIFMLWQGGLVFYGGFILATISLLLFFRYHNLPILKICDILAPSVTLAHGISRLGCLFNGCCFGGICPPSASWGLHYPASSLVGQDLNMAGLNLQHLWSYYGAGTVRGSTEVLAVLEKQLPNELYSAVFNPVYPTQLYSSIFGILFCFALLAFHKYRKNDGEVILAYGMGYSIFRFWVEMVRDDNEPVFGTGLTMSQNISYVMFCLCAGLFLYLRLSRYYKKKSQANSQA